MQRTTALKGTVHFFPQEGRQAGVRKEKKIERKVWSESKKKTKLDQTAVSQKTGNSAGDIAIIKNNRPKMNIIQRSCESSDASDASIASACQRERKRKQR